MEESSARRALDRLRQDAANAIELQEKELMAILAANSSTEYGKRYSFETIKGIEDYQSRVPLSTYDDYEMPIKRMIAGERAILTNDDSVFYAITSGSTDAPKYVPITAKDVLLHRDTIILPLLGMVEEAFPHESSESLGSHIFQTGEFVKTRTESGVLSGVRSASVYEWIDDTDGIDTSCYTSPRALIFPEKLEDLTYLKVRFALADRDLSSIHSVFMHRIVAIIDYIKEHFELLVEDIAKGTVDESIKISSEWKAWLEKELPGDAERARELKDAASEGWHDILPRFWPKLKYLVGICGSSFPIYQRAIEEYWSEANIHHFIYGASEGFFSIANGVNHPDEYLLIPRSGFFEFIPEEGGAPLTIADVEQGKRYEIIFTSHSGLYRYRLLDVIEIVGYVGESPLVKWCYSQNQMLRVADEKMNSEQLRHAIALFSEKAGIEIKGFAVEEVYSKRPGFYRFYIESDRRREDSALMDWALETSSYGYKGCRLMGEISEPEIRFVPEGTFRRRDELLGSKRDMAQYKPAIILKEEAEKDFFEKASEEASYDE